MADPITTVIAGIRVSYTPLVRKAIEHVKSQSPAWLFHHVMRSWLFAAKLAAAENDAVLDEETLALAVLFHDEGLIQRTPARRFEVDGAAAAVEFLRAHQGNDAPGSAEGHRKRLREVLVWHTIALHTTPSIALHAVPEVSFAQRGIAMDIAGFGLDTLPDAQATIAAVLEAFPRLDIKEELIESFCTLARTKPETTYDNVVAGFGEAYVEGYKVSNDRVKQVVVAQANNPLDA